VGSLTYVPILAKFAGKIATECSDGKASCAGKEVEERLLLYWVGPDSAGLTVNTQAELAAVVDPYPAEACIAVAYVAAAVACDALNDVVLELFCKHLRLAFHGHASLRKSRWTKSEYLPKHLKP
jgi:hypothetical protein